MIQDASPVRDGVPDSYLAHYRIEVLVAATTWNVNLERLPSGFTGAGISPNPQQVRTGVGLGTIRFPAGFKVRMAKAGYSAPDNTLANQRQVYVTDIDEAAGTALIVVATVAGAASEPRDPTALPAPNDSWIWVDLTLETV